MLAMTVTIDSIPPITFTTIPSTKSVNVFIWVDDTPRQATTDLEATYGESTGSTPLTVVLNQTQVPQVTVDRDAIATQLGISPSRLTIAMTGPIKAARPGEYQVGLALTIAAPT